MDKQLNREAVERRLEENGLSQSDVAVQLNLSRQAVSKWFTGKSFPRPAELLKLGRLLRLRHNELVRPSLPKSTPLVAFRKRGSCKTTDLHLERAREMGQRLRPLVKYLDFDRFLGPPSLKNPSTDYAYLQALVAKLRREMDVPEDAPVGFEKLIDLFQQYQAVIVPVLWGKKSKHENAIHLYLPDSQTTWIYLNLDVEVHDFKFWMVHELGHVLTVELLREGRIEEAEDFADQFAGSFLFPEPVAGPAYDDYNRQRSDNGRIRIVCKWAEVHMISPNSVYLEIQNFANAYKKPFRELDKPIFHAAISKYNKKYHSLAEALFDGAEPSANQFIRVAQEKFGTEFFKAFSTYVREQAPGPSGIAGILGVNPMDARAFNDALSQ